MSIVETHGLSKSYGALDALIDCGLNISQGEVFGLLGPNGSGKTTLLRLLMGFLRPTAGTARIDGLDCFRESVAVHRRVAYLPGDARLFRQMRGRDVLRFFSALRGASGAGLNADLAARLQPELGRPVASLSTGMRQKLALAAVLSASTPIVILDEPTSNLDPTVRREVVVLVRQAAQAGRTVIFSSHILEEVEQACDRVGILRQGRLAHVQVMAELRRRHRIRARLMGLLPALPAALEKELEISNVNGELRMQTAGELAPLLGWLSTLPLFEVRIEPVGLRALYDTVHAIES